MTIQTTKSKSTNDFRNIKYILTSSMRTRLLLSMKDGGKNLDEFRNIIEKPSATILHGLRELEEKNLVKKSNKHYELTSNGFLITTNMEKLINNWYTIDKNITYWNNHDLSDIPDDLLKTLYLLKDSICIKSTTTDLSNTFKKYVELISNSRELKIIMPIYSENHFRQLIQLLNQNKLEKVELIVTTDILHSMKQNQYLKLSLINNSKVTINSLRQPLKLFLTKSENFVSLTLFFKDGHYDDSQMLVDKTENGLKWAEKLYNAYNNHKVVIK